MKMHLFRRIRQISLHQRVIQQPSNTLQNKMEVFVPMYPRQVIYEQIIWKSMLQKNPFHFSRNLTDSRTDLVAFVGVNSARVVIQSYDEYL